MPIRAACLTNLSRHPHSRTPQISPRPGKPGGASRFSTLVHSYDAENPMVLFSGDCLNPSMSEGAFHPTAFHAQTAHSLPHTPTCFTSASTVTKGSHMVPVLNRLNVAAAVIGYKKHTRGCP